MFRLPCQGLLTRAIVFAGIFSLETANGQVVVAPVRAHPPESLWNRLVSGAQYDVVNVDLAEHRLLNLQEKLRLDSSRGDMASVEQDALRIHDVKHRIMVHEWLIQYNLYQCPGYYPFPRRLDPITRDTLAHYAHSPQAIVVAQPAQASTTPTIPITIVNAEPSGSGIAFSIDGVAHQAGALSHQDLVVAATSSISYDGGGSLGQRQYRISPGTYEFRSTAEGWALYKLPSKP